MNKPEPKQRKSPIYIYLECEAYIESKLGYRLRDTLEKFKDGKSRDVEYRDYWHFIISRHDYITNGSEFEITIDMLDGEDWQNEITQAFIDEFGETSYWVEW